jgi:tRNA pseudouridine55 synthase
LNSTINDLGGILNIDKPEGMTSHDVVSLMRRLTGIRRIGHTGTLDPLATGVLLLCIGRTTRLSEYLIGQDKQYEVAIRLGQETDSYDAEGRIVAEKPVTADKEAIETALNHFRGPISQTPPMFSAVKVDGQPLYKLARKGIESERPSREVTIYNLELLDWNLPELRLSINCSSGTYIRSLAHDLGQLLDCGGHIIALRRTAVASFTVEKAVKLDTMTAENWTENLLPADSAVSHLRAVNFSREEAADLQQGRRVAKEKNSAQVSPDPLIRAYDQDRRFIGIIADSGDYWQPRKILVPFDHKKEG